MKGSSYHNDFARQLAERNASSQSNKKFRSAAAPKGTKLAAGYHDRTQDRIDEEADDRARRIKALEEQVKLEQIDQETFEKLRDQITGGDVGATHLVKGLDWKLLERVKRGEDVMQEKSDKNEEDEKPARDADEELEELEQKKVAPVVREKVVKKGELAPPTIAGTKRNRDAILAELKASRKAAAEAAAAAQPQLGSHFRKVGAEKEPRIEIDERGREVLIVVGENGKIKRKVRKVKDGEIEGGRKNDLLEVDKKAERLGIEQAELPQQPAPEVDEEEDDDIFEGVGAEYDPLAGLEDESDNDSEGEIQDQPSVPRAAPTNNQKAQSIVVSGPSGAGKSTILRRLLDEHGEKFGFSISHTTREKRDDEIAGVSYHYVERDAMERMIEAGDFVETTEYNGNLYGTTLGAVDKVHLTGKTCIFDIEMEGVKQIRKLNLNGKFLFISPPSLELLEARLRSRKTDSEEAIQKRLKRAEAEMEFARTSDVYDKIVMNDNLDTAWEEVKAFCIGTTSRNYFTASTHDESAEEQPTNAFNDPTILAALKSAAKKAKAEDSNADNLDEAERLKRRAAMLSGRDRDEDDMDMGFGSNRFDDAEDADDGGKIKLSEWKGGRGADDEDDGDEDWEKGGKKRKRAPKKRKGDKDSAADVLRVMEGRKSAK